MTTLEIIYNNINNGTTYGENVQGCAGNVYYPVLSVRMSGGEIAYSHYGSSAVANTTEALQWLLHNIFCMTPEEFCAAYVTEPRGRWAEMSDAKKFDALRAAAKSAISMLPNRARRCGYITPQELAGEAWIRLENRLNAGDPRPLRDQILYAALAALHAAARETVHSIGGSMDDETGDNDASETVNSAAHRGTTARPVEDAGAILDTINSAARDDIDRQIIRAAAAGYTLKETGAAVGMSGEAVRKRLNAIRARITSAFIDDLESMPPACLRR